MQDTDNGPHDKAAARNAPAKRRRPSPPAAYWGVEPAVRLRPGEGVTSSFADGLPAAASALFGDLAIAAMDLCNAATRRHRPRKRLLYITSANGEVTGQIHETCAAAVLFRSVDQILADRQPLVLSLRWLRYSR